MFLKKKKKQQCCRERRKKIVEKNITEWEKMLYCNYQKVF